MTDRELLSRYAASGSEEAFAEIVRRHADKVYSVCLRVLGDPHAAEDAAQAVFLVLHRKARSLPARTVLSGWLYLAATRTALGLRQKQARRARREREAAVVRKAEEKPEAKWEEVSPRIDAALAGLPRRHREALVLYYFDGRSESEVARETGCDQSTVSRRLSAALEKLRRRLGAQGATVPAAALGGLLAGNAVSAAPAGLAASIAAACAGQAAASAAALSAAEGIMKAMLWTKVKLAAVALGAVATVGGGAAVVSEAVFGGSCAAMEAKADFYVAADGGDRAPGTEAKPFRTLEQARDAVRKLKRGGLKKDVVVLLRGGTHFLKRPLVFGPEDSGTGKHSITYAAYPGEKPVLSGGRRITGWKRGRGKVWRAQVPEVKAGKWRFRQLFVGGRRAARPRTPYWRLKAVSVAKERYTLTLAPGLLEAWKDAADIEVMVAGDWEINRKRVESVDAAKGVAVLAGPHVPDVHGSIRPKPGRWCSFENVGELLDEPGEWHLASSTGTLRYQPRDAEKMAGAEAVAPVLERLLKVAGAPGRPVRNLHFKGLSFQHAGWALPEFGYHGIQACHYTLPAGWRKGRGRVPAAIRWDYVENSSLRDCTIAHLGGCGLELVEGCNSNAIEGNHIFDVSGSGVLLGGPQDEAGVPKDNRIANNHVHDCGVDFYGAVGIWTGFAQRTVIAHNRVHGLPYTGISVGWQWNPKPTPCKANRLERNHIYDVMRRLADGGGIYTLGFQPGTVIRGNHIHDVRRGAHAQGSHNNGMFIDEGSKGFLFENNVIYRTAGTPVRFNNCRREWHTWKDNHFGGKGTPRLVAGRFGRALACGGGTYLEAPHAPKLEPAAITVEAWIRISEYPAGDDDRRWAVNKNGNEWTQGHYALVIKGREAGAYLNIGGGRKNALAAWSSTAPLKLDRWQLLAMTYDGKTLKVYLNGAPVASKAINRKRAPGGAPLRIGGRQDGFSPVHFPGAIDEVRVYGRALSAEEMRRRHRAPGKVGKEGQPAARWSFDDARKGPGPDESVEKITARAGLEPAYRKRLLPP